ncbi:MAG: response regulator [Elusimicrobia bacterium]|nr:response regulator [Elusimicrobiota bacterium]
MADNFASALPGDRTVLIVEDDEHLRSMLEFFLAKEGFKTLTAANGEEAVAKLSLRPSALLLDLFMPGLGGDGVLKFLRESPEPVLPVVVLTGRENGHPLVQKAAMDSNVRRIYGKPTNVEFLIGALHGLLGTSPRSER